MTEPAKFGDASQVEFNTSEQSSTQESQICPYCAEVIKKAAILCRFCGGKLQPLLTAGEKTQGQKKGGRKEHDFTLGAVGVIAFLGLVVFVCTRPAGPERGVKPPVESVFDSSLPQGWQFFRIYNPELPSEIQLYFELVCTKAPYDTHNPDFTDGCRAVIPDLEHGASPDHLLWTNIANAHLRLYGKPVLSMEVPPEWREALRQKAKSTIYWSQ